MIDGATMSKTGSPHPPKIPIRGVIFDYGNVLCHTQQLSDLESMAQSLWYGHAAFSRFVLEIPPAL